MGDADAQVEVPYVNSEGEVWKKIICKGKACKVPFFRVVGSTMPFRCADCHAKGRALARRQRLGRIGAQSSFG